MAGERATTIRFSDSIYQRLEAAGQLTGLPINSIVVVACLEWLDAHQPEAGTVNLSEEFLQFRAPARQWAKVTFPMGKRRGTYPFDRFSQPAREALVHAQEEAGNRGHSYIEPEHLLLGLLRLKAGFAAAALPALGIDQASVETQLESGPHKPVIERVIPTSRTRRVIESAFRLANDWQHGRVGTGHLLMSLVQEADGVTAAVFREKGVTVERLSAEAARLRGTVGPED